MFTGVGLHRGLGCYSGVTMNWMVLLGDRMDVVGPPIFDGGAELSHLESQGV
jgi:hypothetical protein